MYVASNEETFFSSFQDKNFYFFCLKSENSNEVHTTWLPHNLQWKTGLSPYIFNQGGSRHMNFSLETCCVFCHILPECIKVCLKKYMHVQ